MTTRATLTIACLKAVVLLESPRSMAQASRGSQVQELPDPDGQPAKMGKRVQVFILMGQSNMLGFGSIGPEEKEGTLEHAVKEEGLYPFLVDEEGAWTERFDLRNVRVMVSEGGMRVFNNEWMSIRG